MKIDLSRVRLVSLDDLERLVDLVEPKDDITTLPDWVQIMIDQVYDWAEEVKGK